MCPDDYDDSKGDHKTVKLQFDAENHAYPVDGVLKPSVSKILKTVGLSKDFSGVDSFYRDRGIAVAKAIELYLKNDLDEKTLDPVLLPYFDGFKRYWDKHGVDASHIVEIETPRYQEHFGYCGTPDLIIHGKVIDWKCSKDHDKVAELQGEAYKLFFPVAWPFEVVQFPGNGSFEIFEYGDRVDTWPSVMKCYEWYKKVHPRSK